MAVFLKKMLRKGKDVRSLVADLSRGLGGPVAVLSPDGDVLFGKAAPDAGWIPVRARETELGWVAGPEAAARPVADLLALLAAREMDRRILAQETLEGYKEMNLLFNLAERISGTLDLGKVGTLVLEEALRCIQGTAAAMMLIDEISGRFHAVAGRGRPPEDPAAAAPGAGIAGRVFAGGRAEIVNDVAADPDYLEGRRPVRSMICAPLRTTDRTIGVMAIASEAPVEYTAADLKLITTLAVFAASAIQNSLAHRELAGAYETLKQLQRAKEKAVNHLSHELKTPLSVIRSVFALLDRKLGAGEPAALDGVERALARGVRNLDRLLKIQEQIDDILGAGDARPAAPEAIEADRFLHGICDAAEAAMEGREVEILRDLEPGVTVRMDREVLRKVCGGLLKNAVENTPDEGWVRVDLGRREDGVRIRVVDQGVGITPENRDLVFGGFFHTGSTDQYASKLPYRFNAGGAGSDLLRIKVFSERYGFTIEFTSTRCPHLPRETDPCPGRISRCAFVADAGECMSLKSTVFSLTFPA